MTYSYLIFSLMFLWLNISTEVFSAMTQLLSSAFSVGRTRTTTLTFVRTLFLSILASVKCMSVLPKSLSQRKSCKIQFFVHKQGWPILIMFGGLEGLCTSIPNILYFLSEIQNGRRTGRHLDFPILGLKCPWNCQKLDPFHAVIFL